MRAGMRFDAWRRSEIVWRPRASGHFERTEESESVGLQSELCVRFYHGATATWKAEVMKTIAVKALRWVTIVSALIFSIDALLSIYKTIIFREGIDNRFDFLGVLLVCFLQLVVVCLTGIGAYTKTNTQGSLFQARVILGIAVWLGLIILSTNAIPLSYWISTALVSKSESIAASVALCCLLLWLTRRNTK